MMWTARLITTRNAMATRLVSTLLGLVIPVTHMAGTVGASNSTQPRQKQDEEGDMVRGLIIGFGGFFGFIILLCIWWRCCCSNGNEDVCSCCQRKAEKQRPRANGKAAPPGRGRIKLGNDHKVSPSPPSSVMSWSRNS